MKTLQIALDQLSESPTNPRKRYDEGALRELADSIKQAGLIHPLTVRPQGDRFEIVAGSRRFRAAGIAGLKKVRCEVVDLTDDQVLEIQVQENMQRADVSPIEEARAFQSLIDSGRYGAEAIKAIADKVGRTPRFVHQRLHLLGLTPEIQDAVDDERFPVGHALLLAPLGAETQSRMFEAATEPRGAPPAERRVDCTLAALRQAIEQDVYRDLASVPWDTTDDQLVPKAGSCTDCPKRSRAMASLFEDGVDGPDHCLDPACFRSKMSAHIKKRIEALKEEGQEVVLAGYEWYWADRREMAETITEACDVALHVGASASDKPTGIIGIAPSGAEVYLVPPQRGTGSNQGTSKNAEKAEKERVALQIAFLSRLADGIRENFPTDPSEVLKLVLRNYAERELCDTWRAEICEFAGIGEPAPAEAMTMLAAAIDEADSPEALAELALAVFVGSEIHNLKTAKWAMQGDRLKTMAKALGIDPTAIRKAVKDELKEAAAS